MIRALLAMLLISPDAVTAQPTDAAIEAPAVELRALDRVNGQTVDLQMQVGDEAEVFGLRVAVAECRYPQDNPTGDAFAYLSVREPGKPETSFDGWMIASSPALSALDHARYDVWVLRCVIS